MAPITATGQPPITPGWVSGAALPTTEDRLEPVIQSRTTSMVGRYYSCTPDDARLAARSSATAFQTWKHTSPYTRRDILLKVADTYEKRADELAKMQDDETCMGLEFGRFQVKFAAANMRAAAAACMSIEGVIPPSENDTVPFVFKEPVGPVLAIAPWNGPLILASRLSNALAAGCTVVLKASELCPRSHHAIVEIFEECGLPAGVLNQIQCRREDGPIVTEAIISDPAIRKIEFTGSAAVGRIIGAVAARHLKPVLMELGGKGPALVLEDADLDSAAVCCAKGALIHHGQVCFSTERVIVRIEVADAFQQKLVAEFEKYASAGSAATEGFAKHAADLLEDAEAHGAKFLTGGIEYLGKVSLKPTIVANVSKDARMRDEESFGPSTSLYIVHSDQEAIELANESSYGLNAAIHTKDIGRALKIGRELEYGQVHVNSITPNDQPHWPIGGVKGSGWGRNNAHWGVEEFLTNKLIAWHSGPPVFGS